jgi:hypothetical protein
MTKVCKPLWKRIKIVNATFVSDENPHIAFDIAVDDTVVAHTLEWLKADPELVTEDRHLDVNSEYRDAVATALGDDREHYDEASDDAHSGVFGDISDIVWEKLITIVRDLRKSKASAAA